MLRLAIAFSEISCVAPRHVGIGVRRISPWERKIRAIAHEPASPMLVIGISQSFFSCTVHITIAKIGEQAKEKWRIRTRLPCSCPCPCLRLLLVSDAMDAVSGSSQGRETNIRQETSKRRRGTVEFGYLIVVAIYISTPVGTLSHLIILVYTHPTTGRLHLLRSALPSTPLPSLRFPLLGSPSLAPLLATSNLHDSPPTNNPRSSNQPATIPAARAHKAQRSNLCIGDPAEEEDERGAWAIWVGGPGEVGVGRGARAGV